jgi:ESF2/ABP1 family protein
MSGDESSVDLSLLSEGDSADEEETAARRNSSAECSVMPHSEGGLIASEVQEQQQLDQQQGGHSSEQPEAGVDPKPKKRSKVLSSKKLQRIKEQHRRRGILYMSRIPPHMKPAKIKQLLTQYGEIGRIYCKPEDASIRKQRIVKGGNTGTGCACTVNLPLHWTSFKCL